MVTNDGMTSIDPPWQERVVIVNRCRGEVRGEFPARRARNASGAADVRVSRSVEVLALFRELLDQRAQLLDAAFRGADRQAVLAARIAARLARVEPILHGAGQQPVGDIPEVGFLVAVRDLVAEVDGLAK